jgi:hypothetical protein
VVVDPQTSVAKLKVLGNRVAPTLQKGVMPVHVADAGVAVPETTIPLLVTRVFCQDEMFSVPAAIRYA